MPPGKLEPSVLVALGLLSTAGCGDKEDTGPCLDYAADTGDTGDTGPCLDYATESAGEPAAARVVPAAPPPADRDAATQRVLERGVLPADVAALLRRSDG